MNALFMKKVLITASVISFIECFNKENIEFLRRELGCEVHIACNCNYLSNTDEVSMSAYIRHLNEQGVILHNIAFTRSPLSKDNIKAYRELKQVIDSCHFDLIHCHTPAVGVLTRLAARRARSNGAIIMYTCHGFHFHNASPKKNWLIYYPVEWALSCLCDYIVTINKEDFRRAQSFHCKNVRYIPGVGANLAKLRSTHTDKEAKKESIGVPADALLLVSVGELICRKNHAVIIRALAKLQRPDLYYAIAGKGELRNYLGRLAEELGVADKVKFLGFRSDVYELYHAAEISAFPSLIEGLGLAGIEAMAIGLPLVASNVHGILDYVEDGKTGYAVSPDDVDGFAAAILRLVDSPELREKMKPACLAAVEPFDLPNALHAMWEIYRETLGEKMLNQQTTSPL